MFSDWWIQKDVDFLKANYESRGPTYCSRIIGKTPNAIRHKAYSFDLRFRPPSTRNKERLRELIESGLSRRDIASHMGVSRNTIYRWCREEGIPSPSVEDCSRWANESRKRAAREDGCKTYGEWVAVRRRVKALMQERGCYSVSDVRFVRALRTIGKPATMVEIASFLGLSHARSRAVIGRLARNGVLIRCGKRQNPARKNCYSILWFLSHDMRPGQTLEGVDWSEMT